MGIFEYTWKSADGKRHSGEIEAPDRDAAFKLLRKQGIRAIKVEPKGWSTGEGYSNLVLWKRIGIVLISVTLVILLGFVLKRKDGGVNVEEQHVRGMMSASKRHASIESPVVELQYPRHIARPLPRRQIANAVSPLFVPDGTFRYQSEKALIPFAQPGRLDYTNAIINLTSTEFAEDFYDALGNDIWIEQNDSRSIAELKRIVTSLKEEAEMMYSSGKSIPEIFEYFSQRQKIESRHRRQIIEEHTRGTRTKEEVNTDLSIMGLQLLTD